MPAYWGKLTNWLLQRETEDMAKMSMWAALSRHEFTLINLRRVDFRHHVYKDEWGRSVSEN